MANSAPNLAPPSFSQSSAIAFSILIGFLVFITCRGELGAYFAVFLGRGGAGLAPGSAAAGNGGGELSKLLGTAGSGGASSTPATNATAGGTNASTAPDAVINVSHDPAADNQADGADFAPAEYDNGISPDGGY